MCSFGGGVSSCPLVQRSAGFRCFRTCRTCRRLALVLLWCVPCLLPACLLCLWCIASEHGSISRFKGVFRGFYGVDVCLYGFGVLRGLCGFCARVELGGLKACGVFAPIFSFFHLLRISSGALPLLSLACPLGCLASDLGLVLSLFVGRCCFFFPFGIYAKRKGAPCWCVLSCPVVVALVVIPSLQFSGFYSVLHPCNIVNRCKVPIPSVTVVIEANKCKIGSGCILYDFNFPISEVLPCFWFSVLF